MKEGDNSKSEDKDNDAIGTAGSHVGDITTPEDLTASSRGASIGAHILETNGKLSCPARSVEEILGAYPINNDLWVRSNPSDVSIDIANSKEVMTGSHITE